MSSLGPQQITGACGNGLQKRPLTCSEWVGIWLCLPPKEPMLSISPWINFTAVNYEQSSSTSYKIPFLVSATANHPCRCHSSSKLAMVPQGSGQQVHENCLAIRLCFGIFSRCLLYPYICTVKEAILQNEMCTFFIENRACIDLLR